MQELASDRHGEGYGFDVLVVYVTSVCLVGVVCVYLKLVSQPNKDNIDWLDQCHSEGRLKGIFCKVVKNMGLGEKTCYMLNNRIKFWNILMQLKSNRNEYKEHHSGCFKS